MSYKIVIIERALQEFGALPSGAYEEIRDFIRELAKTPRQLGSIRLVGREGWYVGIGNYRVIYEIDDEQRKITILHIRRGRSLYQ